MNIVTKGRFVIIGVGCVAFVVGGVLSAVLFQYTFWSNDTVQGDQVASEVSQNGDLDLEATPGNVMDSIGGPILDGIASLSEFDNDFDRILTLYLYLSRLDETELVNLVGKTLAIESDLRIDTQEALFQRLTFLDPGLAFSEAENLDPILMTTVFVQWSRTELNKAIEHAKGLDHDRKSFALRGILTSRQDLPEDIRLQIGKELGNEGLARSLVNSSRLDKYAESPAESWHEIIGDAQHNPSQLGMLHTLARVWFEQEGLSVLEPMNRSLTNLRARNSILGTVLHMAVRSDPQRTFDIALRMDNDVENKIVASVAQIWATTDPNAALNAVNKIEPIPLRKKLMTAVMHLWAEDDALTLLESLEGLDEDTLAIGLELGIKVRARRNPDQAAKLVERMEEGSGKREVLHSIASNWMLFEPRAALDWILTDTDTEPYRQDLLRSTLPSLAAENPELAFATALAQPIEENKPGLEVAVISRLAQLDLSRAKELLGRVRAGLTKRNAYSQVGRMMVTSDSPLEAMELMQQLPESDREPYLLFTMGTWAQHDPEGMLGEIARLPSAEAKSKAAAMLVFSNQFKRTLTDDQMQQASSFLSDRDSKSLEEGGLGLLNPILDMDWRGAD